MNKNWDAFISHASEDKDSMVRQLADTLISMGVKVWYDESNLMLGDSISKSIDEGLLQSNFGILVISKKFIGKRWTDYELRSLLSKEENNKKLILPIWHGITLEEVKSFSLYLSDKRALDTATLSINQLAVKIVEIVRPDIYRGIKAYFLFKKLLRSAKVEKIESTALVKQTVPQSKLTKHLEVRARNIHYGIGKALNLAIDESILNYELDLRPEIEIQIWETMNLCYQEFIDKYKLKDYKIKNEVAKILVLYSVAQIPNKTSLSEEQLLDLFDIWSKYYSEY